jgi:hypothetical protein
MAVSYHTGDRERVRARVRATVYVRACVRASSRTNKHSIPCFPVGGQAGDRVSTDKVQLGCGSRGSCWPHAIFWL